MYTIQKTVTIYRGTKTRLHIRRFKTSDAMHSWLNSRDNTWSISKHDLKSGVYAYAGGKYHNVKSLDPSILNHI